MPINTRSISIGILLLLTPAAALASRPQRWIVTTQSDFQEGEFNGVAVSSKGMVSRAPSLELVLDTKQAYVHSAVADASGTLYVGTGNEGKIFRIQPGSEGSEFADLDENGVFALAVDSSGRLYAATAPDGNVYRIDAQGNAEVFASPGEKYLWDLAFDQQGNLFVATGPKGIIYKVDSQGKMSSFFDCDEFHIVRLAFDIDGNLLAGTAPGGELLRIAPDGKASVLFDSDLEEIKAIASDRYGTLYATALSYEANTPTPAGTRANRPRAVTISPKAEGEDSETVEVEGTRKGKKLEVYRISREGLVDTIYSEDNSMAFDLLVRPDLSVLLATSDRGRILSLDQNRFLKLLAQSPDDQVTHLIQAGDAIFATTSNLGKVYRLGGNDSTTGVYESKVFDGSVLSHWGRLEWRTIGSGGQAPQLFSRSGNTKEPDKTWSDWDGPYSNSDGEAIQSAPARFFQWKAEFAGPSPSVTAGGIALDSVGVSYLQDNVAPQITQLTVHPAGSGFVTQPAPQLPGSGSLGGPDKAHIRSLPPQIRDLEGPQVKIPPRQVFIPGARALSWEASDANDDDLTYSIQLRAQGESEWRVLVEKTEDNHYTLDGTSLPDGTYLFRVTASDLASNPPALAKESRLSSRPFQVSNTPPSIEISEPSISGTGATLEFEARTPVTPLYQAEHSLDAGDWQILYPEDGIADSRQESYRISLSNLSRGEHTLLVRVVDVVGNIGTGKVTFTIQ